MGDLTVNYDKRTTLSLDLTMQTNDVHAVEAESSSPGSSLGQGHYVVSLGKNVTHSASLHPGL